MKILQTIPVLGAAALLAVPTLAQCPDATGIWSTTTGTMLGGRASEAWCTLADGGVPGNTQNAMSWDAVNLGTQWRAWGMAIDVCCITMSIDCAVPTDHQTWSNIKAMYR